MLWASAMGSYGPGRGLGNAVQVATAGPLAALGVGAAVRDAAGADGAADGFLADAFLLGGLMNVDFGVQPSPGSLEELAEQGAAGGSGKRQLQSALKAGAQPGSLLLLPVPSRWDGPPIQCSGGRVLQFADARPTDTIDIATKRKTLG